MMKSSPSNHLVYCMPIIAAAAFLLAPASCTPSFAAVPAVNQAGVVLNLNPTHEPSEAKVFTFTRVNAVLSNALSAGSPGIVLKPKDHDPISPGILPDLVSETKTVVGISPSIEAYLGFNDRQMFHKTGIPQILRTTVSNPTESTLDCRVTITQDAMEESPVSIELRIMPTTVFTLRIPVVLAKDIRSVSLVLHEKSGNKFLDSWKINVATLAVEDRFTLVIGGRNLVDGQFYNLATSPKNNGAVKVNQKYATHCEISEVPSDWEYFLVADTVVVSEEAPLEKKLMDALFKYSWAGGRIVLVCGTRPGRFDSLCGTAAFPGTNPRRSPLEVPLSFIAPEKKALGYVKSGFNFTGGPVSGESIRTHVLEADGFEIAGRKYAPWGVPIVYTFPSGLGEISFVMIDHETASALRPHSEESLFASLTDPQGFLAYAGAMKPNLSCARPLPDKLATLMPLFDETLQIRIPGKGFVLLFVTAYLTVGFGLNYLILKGSGRLEFGWVFLMVTAVIFAVGLHGSSVTPSGPPLSVFGVTFQFLGDGIAAEPTEAFWAVHSGSGCVADLYFDSYNQIRFRDETAASAAGVYETPVLEWTAGGQAARNVKIRQKSYRFVSARRFSKPLGYLKLDISGSAVEVSAEAPGELLFQIWSADGSLSFGHGSGPGAGKTAFPHGGVDAPVAVGSREAALAAALSSLFSRMPSTWWVGVFREFEPGMGVSGIPSAAGGYRVVVKEIPQVSGNWTTWIETSYDAGSELDGRRLYSGRERVYLVLQSQNPSGMDKLPEVREGFAKFPEVWTHEVTRRSGMKPDLGKVIGSGSFVSVINYATGFFKPFEKFDSSNLHPVTGVVKFKIHDRAGGPGKALVLQ